MESNAPLAKIEVPIDLNLETLRADLDAAKGIISSGTREWGTALSKTSEGLKSLHTNTALWSKSIQQAATELRQLKNEADKARKAADFGGALESVGRRAFVGITLPLAAATGAVTKWGMDFQGAMTESTAIMGDLSAEMRREMEDTAMEVSNVTKYSATQAAEAYYPLISSGLDAQRSMEALPVVAKFAQAGVMDLATATDTLTKSQNALGMTSDDSAVNLGNLARIANVLVSTNNSAVGSVLDFATALQNKAAAAMRALNIPLEEGMAALAVFIERGDGAAEAGEHFSIVLRDMQVAYLNNKKAWSQHGLSPFDAQGQIRPLADVVDELTKKLKAMSPEMAQATLMALGFQMRSVEATRTLLGTSDRLRDLTKNLQDTGNVLDVVAAKQVQNFSSDLLLMYHRTQAAGIALYRDLEPALRENVSPALADASAWLETTTQRFTDLSAGAKLSELGVLGAIGSLSLIAMAAGSAVSILGSTATLAIGGTVAALVVLGGALMVGIALWDRWGVAVESGSQSGNGLFSELLTQSGQLSEDLGILTLLAAGFGTALGMAVAPEIVAAGAGLVLLGAGLQMAGFGFEDLEQSAASSMDAVTQGVMSGYADLQLKSIELRKNIATSVSGAADEIMGLVDATAETTGESGSMWTWFEYRVAETLAGTTTYLQEWSRSQNEELDKQAGDWKDWSNAVQENVGQSEGALAGFLGYLKELPSGMKAAWDFLMGNPNPAFSSGPDGEDSWLGTPHVKTDSEKQAEQETKLKDALAKAKQQAIETAKAIRDEMGQAGGALSGAGDEADKAAKKLEDLKEKAEQIRLQAIPAEGLGEAIAQLDELAQKFPKILDDKAIRGALQSIWKEFDGKPGVTPFSDLGKQAEGVRQTVLDTFNTIRIQAWADEIKKGGQELTEELLKAQQQEEEQRRQKYDQLAGEADPVGSMFKNLQDAEGLIREFGGVLNAEMGEFLAQKYWGQFSDQQLRAFEEMLPRMKDLSDESKAAIERMITNEEAARQKKKFQEIANGAQQINSAIQQLPDQFKDVKDAALIATDAITLAVQIAGKNWVGAASSAIMMVADLFGIMGDKGEKEIKGLDKAMQELGDAVEDWGQDFTDMFVEFVKTGELAIHDFLVNTMSDIVEIMFQTAIVDPIVGAIHGAFAKGGAFDSSGGAMPFAKGGTFTEGRLQPFAAGGIVSMPTLFPMRGDKVGVMGELKNEAVMPLDRTAAGDLGVNVAGLGALGGGSTVVNVIDNRGANQPPVEVSRRTLSDGTEMIDVVVAESWRRQYHRGEFDGDLKGTHGVSRRGARRS